MIQNTRNAKSLRDIVDEIMDRWRAGDTPNALGVFEELPDVMQHHSLAIDLAYEEFCLREESGEEIDPTQYCQRFSRLRHSLGRMLKLHGLMQSKSLGLPAEKTITWPAVGKQWLDWLLVEEIGRGAFSRVFLAEEPSLGNRRVVVKCSHSGPGEAYIQGKFAHPNLMPVHSIRTDAERGLVGICMPLLGRVTLAQVLDRVGNSHAEAISPRVFSPEYGAWPDHVPDVSIAERRKYSLEVVRLVELVARGLEAAHRLGVLHGDIKPSNILLSLQGEPLLVDFNLSIAEQSPQQRLGGTPPYMAPERLPLLTLQGLQAATREQKADESPREPEYRSDVFSLGVVLYELLFGKTPFELQWTDLTAHYEPTQTAELVPGTDVTGQPISSPLAELVRRSIALDPLQRFASVKEMAAALQTWREDQCRRERVAQRRNVLAYLTGGAATAALAIGLLTPTKVWNADYWEIERIIARIDAGDFISASERLEALDKRMPRREFKAWRGYCSAKLSQISNAEKIFESAEPNLDSSGITWHCIGLCRALRNSPDEASLAFDRALELNPYLWEAYWERAAIQLRIPKARQTASPTRVYNDVRRAIELGPAEPYLSFDAAHVFAQGSKEHPSLADQAKSFIRLALEQGISPDTFKKISAFRKFDIDALTPAQLPPPAPARTKADDFLPPAYDLRAIFE